MNNVGGVLTLPSFQRDFRYGDSQRKTINSNAVSILQASAFFGCFFTMPIASKLGRLSGLILSALVFTVGTILQVMNAHTLGAFYAGRVIAGVGIGAATTLIPMFSAEMAPKEIRGRLGACLVVLLLRGYDRLLGHLRCVNGPIPLHETMADCVRATAAAIDLASGRYVYGQGERSMACFKREERQSMGIIDMGSRRRRD
jgi:hypothetical protein